MRMFFDTETTGLPRSDRPADHDSQPYPIQVAAILETLDGQPVRTFAAMLQPSSFTRPLKWMDEGAIRAHGISIEYAEKYGMPAIMAYHVLSAMWRETTELVGHNISFDVTIHHRFAQLVGMPRPSTVSTFCTMNESTKICRIPRSSGSGLKSPNLGEAYFHFTRKKLPNAHDALADVYGARAVWRGIMRSRAGETDTADGVDGRAVEAAAALSAGS